MPEPQQHAEGRGWIESILRHIPGFKGYLEKSYRRESDRLEREWLADRLQRAKQGVNDYELALTNAGKIDELPRVEQMRSRLDRVISRLRGSVSGYSGFFDFVQVKEDDLDDAYALDHALISEVDALGQRMEELPASTEPAAKVVPQLLAQIDSIESKVDQREDLLRGIGS